MQQVNISLVFWPTLQSRIMMCILALVEMSTNTCDKKGNIQLFLL